MSIYVGASNAKKEAAQLYLGRDGTKSEVTEAYALKDGAVQEVFNAAPEPGQQVFTTSGEFTVPKGVRKVDVFLVGGGGCGSNTRVTSYSSYGDWYSACGGGGGYTTTQKGISVKAGDQYAIVVGDGARLSNVGGTSSAFGTNAAGGQGYSNFIFNGGSGGGHGVYMTTSNGYKRWGTGAARGGSDGSSSQQHQVQKTTGPTSDDWSYTTINTVYGKGQESTTRAFGEESGTLYAGGGGGSGYLVLVNSAYEGAAGGSGGGGKGGIGNVTDGSLSASTAKWQFGDNYTSYYNAESGSEGTGGGGGGRGLYFDTSSISDLSKVYGVGEPGYGGSGCVIVRWGY